MTSTAHCLTVTSTFFLLALTFTLQGCEEEQPSFTCANGKFQCKGEAEWCRQNELECRGTKISCIDGKFSCENGDKEFCGREEQRCQEGHAQAKVKERQVQALFEESAQSLARADRTITRSLQHTQQHSQTPADKGSAVAIASTLQQSKTLEVSESRESQILSSHSQQRFSSNMDQNQVSAVAQEKQSEEVQGEVVQYKNDEIEKNVDLEGHDSKSISDKAAAHSERESPKPEEIRRLPNAGPRARRVLLETSHTEVHSTGHFVKRSRKRLDSEDETA